MIKALDYKEAVSVSDSLSDWVNERQKRSESGFAQKLGVTVDRELAHSHLIWEYIELQKTNTEDYTLPPDMGVYWAPKDQYRRLLLRDAGGWSKDFLQIETK